MFDDQEAVIYFRLMSSNTNTASHSVSFLGRDIRVSDLKEKIGDRLNLPTGSALVLFDSTGKRELSDNDEKVLAYSEVLVQRTLEAGQGTAAPRAPPVTAAATAAAAAAAAASSSSAGTAAPSSSSSHHADTKHAPGGSSSSFAKLNFGAQSSSTMTQEETFQAMADAVARDTGADSGFSNFSRGGGGRGGSGFPRGGGGRGGAAAFQNPMLTGPLNQGDAPREDYICNLCGRRGHKIEHCPMAQQQRGGARQQHVRRFAQPIGVPDTELEECDESVADYHHRGKFVRRKVSSAAAAGVLAAVDASGASSSSSSASAKEKFKCAHCGAASFDPTFFYILPCKCDAKIACRRCVDDLKCIEMSDDGPVCAKCKREVDSDDIVAAKTGDDLRKSGERRDRP